MFKSGERAGAVAIHLAMRAVVKAEDVAGADSDGVGAISHGPLRMIGDGLHARNQPFRRFFVLITRNQRPHGRAVAEFAGRRDDPRIAHPKGRAKPFGCGADRIRDRVVAKAQLNPDLCGRQPQKIRVRFGVIPNAVSARDGFSNQLRTFADVSANQEKCRLSVVTVEKIEQLGRDRRIRPIVKRDRQFTG